MAWRRRQSDSQRDGFTIVELLIVIVVIAILAAITIVAYNGITNRARATAVVSALRTIDDTFHIMATNENRSTWWKDTDFTGVNNPTISDIIANSSMGDYFSKTPSSLTIQYDNDSDSRDPNFCVASSADSGTDWIGVIIAVSGMTPEITAIVDKTLDDGNPLCGRVRYSGPTMTGLVYPAEFHPANSIAREMLERHAALPAADEGSRGDGANAGPQAQRSEFSEAALGCAFPSTARGVSELNFVGEWPEVLEVGIDFLHPSIPGFYGPQ